MDKNYAGNNIKICLLSSQILVSIICITHLFVTANFLFHATLSVFILPISVVSAIGLNFLFRHQLKIDARSLVVSTMVCVMVFISSLLIASYYFDLSWDGQWYHQAAVYNLADSWNPIYKPMVTPDGLNHTSILHFPKNSWYFAAAVTRIFGTAEVGKAYNFIMLIAAFGVVLSFCRDLNISTCWSIIITLLVLLNPVVWSEITTYLNDGAIYLVLIIYLASIVSWIRNSKTVHLLVSVMAICCLVNIKFTGLVFFLITSFFVFIYVLWQKRGLTKPFLRYHIIAVLLAILLFGFNPYVTNFINRGNPFYPLMGSKQFPGVLDKNVDDNEAYETPKNMQGKSLPIRFIYANFGYPGNAPYNGEDTARLINPFLIPAKSWKAYHFHETRVSGFGPYFGILLLLSAFVLMILLFFSKKFRFVAFIFSIGLCCCVSLSKHFWWPRLVPMIWLFPLLPVLLLRLLQGGEYTKNRKSRDLFEKTIFWVLVLFIGINGSIVAIVHMRWETTSSKNLRSELEKIQNDSRPIEIDYGWFKRATEEKMEYWKITYSPASLTLDTNARTLTSVVKGYPNQILYRIK